MVEFHSTILPFPMTGDSCFTLSKMSKPSALNLMVLLIDQVHHHFHHDVLFLGLIYDDLVLFHFLYGLCEHAKLLFFSYIDHFKIK